MAADGGRLGTDRAPQACAMCKTRKKKCNKSLPSCGYCIRKHLDCVYALIPRPANHAALTIQEPVWGVQSPAKIVPSRLVSERLRPDQGTSDFNHQVYLEVHGMIRSTGQFADDISSSYFQGFHRYLPIISRPCFYHTLTTSGTSPEAGFPILLLVMYMITRAPALGYQARYAATGSVDQQTLYLTAKSLFAQVQGCCPPSVLLIQASIMLAVYEYSHGQLENAFATITGSARMAFAARIHTGDRYPTHMARTVSHDTEVDLCQRTQERANTWWGIVICERIFFSELAVIDQPLLTTFPAGNSRLPIELQDLDQLDTSDLDSLPNIAVSCLNSLEVGGFGRTAQATSFLDLVFKAIGDPDIDSRLLQLDRLDTTIQEFLWIVMSQYQGLSGGFCVALHMAIRAMFTLHWHILGQHLQVVRASFKSPEEWHKKSLGALGTVTKMVVDMAESILADSVANATTKTIDAMPPTYPHIARAALKHIRSSKQGETLSWPDTAEDVIQTSLDRYVQRWALNIDIDLPGESDV